MLELGGIIILGILAQWVAWKFKIPAILPLILIGLFVGPISTLFTYDGSKWIEPIWDGEVGIFPGERLFNFVSLAIGIILFEGGLTLRFSEIKNVGPVITKLIIIGSLVTFFGAGAAAYYIFDLSLRISFLFAALIIVTGPTVITPILRNIPLKKDISAILKWEGILIDPIGALVAVLVFEFISVGAGSEFTLTALEEFGKIVLFGFTFGFTFAHALAICIKRNIIPHYLLNVFTLACVLGVFVLSDLFAHESGLLSVVVMGMVMGNMKLPNIKELLYFKESLSVLLISLLFILLSANIEMQDLYLVYTWKAALLFAVVVFVLRPIGVFLSAKGSGLKFNEKLFVSWVGPRGIVAAGIASLFGLQLVSEGVEGAEYITPLVFMIVLGTVLLNATTARLFAKIVGVFLKESKGIVIIGASKASRIIGEYLMQNGRHVVLVDSNSYNIEKAKDRGLEAIEESIYSDSLMNNIELNDVGYLMALTGNGDINEYAINRFKNIFGENGSFRLITPDEMRSPQASPHEGLFSPTDDFIRLTEVARAHPTIQEIDIESKEAFVKLVKSTRADENIVPIFLKKESGELEILKSNLDEVDVESFANTKLVYLGKPFDPEEVAVAKKEAEETETED
ncbi:MULTISPECIES: cation:proton antiporter [Leeuwenhoekiella]|uniref:Sodium/proton antiporter (CPA1 family) n=1 Tax=Leeuwenhoekiella palythoae TaxID=573501 RepID=A0A1M5VXX2_9FLAO|nr:MULTISPECIES: sodium:proton antiporter [Leeuwenhoekiella]MEC7784105.1 sodium:proton antiporter [Bacteroidota bacterium]HBO30692.1 cell shape-determining protein [Leeuwenhoekiella sp.]MEC8682826.1 sodium:proton antiporter [Bacteroidota bacterium]MEE3226568.1 sodium:proton antiporter [Bacteroidota bacterium]MEE3245595.1 sodium:proton antiporter [Bacteroidota bacterium]